MIMAQHPRIQEQDSCNDKSKITSTTARKTEGISAINHRVQTTKQQGQPIQPHQKKGLVPLVSSDLSNHLQANQLVRRKASEPSNTKTTVSARHTQSQRQMQQKVASQGLRPSSRLLQNQQSGASAATMAAATAGVDKSKRQQLEQTLVQQDGKRTLIKNQLYLIEHLQLENASLRNERDQLQLENEELKFQLQMISSSNILSQPGAASSLEPLVECVAVNQKPARLQREQQDCATSKQVINLHATPLRQPVSASGNKQLLQHQHHQHQEARSQNSNGFLFNWNQLGGNTTKQPSDQLKPAARDMKLIDGRLVAACATPQHANKKTTTTPTAVATAIIGRLTSTNEPSAAGGGSNSDEDEQYYDAVSDEVRAAAIVIQKAFRKYQICKRFRDITEQLRHTGRQGPLLDTANTRKQVRAKSANEPTPGVKKAVSSQQVNLLSTTGTGSPANAFKQKQQLQQDSAVAAAITNFRNLESIRKRQYRVGLNIFNKNPEKGVSFLIAHSFIDSSSPYNKVSSAKSYYYSNQLHFMDSNSGQKPQKQQQQQQQQSIVELTPQQKQQQQQQQENQQLFARRSDLCQLLQNGCKLCLDEENLKQNVAHFLLNRKGLAKEKIGQYLGNLQATFNQDVLKYYLQEIDFCGDKVDDALRKFLSTFRLPGEAQKIERMVDCFAQRYVQCQQQQQLKSNNTCFDNEITLVTSTGNGKQQQQDAKSNCLSLSKDEVFILSFAIIMLNTDLHSPSLKPTSRMSGQQFVNNLRGVFKSETIHESDLIEIYERVKNKQIATAQDHVSHVLKVQQSLTMTNFQKKEPPNLCVPHRRLVCFCRLFEVYDVNKKEKVGQHQREIFLFNDLLLVTKLARRAKSNANQQYIYRQIVVLQGLSVQLFQAPYYTFGIRLFNRTTEETIIMFNARNELDQSNFVHDLSESIAEMDEMESIKARSLVDIIHFKYTEKVRRHEMMHQMSQSNVTTAINCKTSIAFDKKTVMQPSFEVRANCDTRPKSNESSDQWATSMGVTAAGAGGATPNDVSLRGSSQQLVKGQLKSNSMLNLSTTPSSADTSGDLNHESTNADTSGTGSDSSGNTGSGSGIEPTTNAVAAVNVFAANQAQNQESNKCSTNGIDKKQLPPPQTAPPTTSQQAGGGPSSVSSQLAKSSRRLSNAANQSQQKQQRQPADGLERRSSTSSVYSLDSGLFLSRDVSPNQSS